MQQLGLQTAQGAPLTLMFYPQLMAALAATGVVLGAVYLLHLFQKTMFGPIVHEENKKLHDLNSREIWTFIPLLVLIFVMGIYPKPFLQRMEPSVNLFLKQYSIKFAQSQLYPLGPPKQVAELNYRRQFGRTPQAVLEPHREAK
jgi:formate hydrogenlyase subunit 3/multisubunit Na+/H+ antiporter MnhD subunit